MKKDALEVLTIFDINFGLTFLLVGIFYTFLKPYVGWGLIILGIWFILHFYYLTWGVEEILKEENYK